MHVIFSFPLRAIATSDDGGDDGNSDGDKQGRIAEAGRRQHHFCVDVSGRSGAGAITEREDARLVRRLRQSPPTVLLSVRLLQRWWTVAPSAFSVSRDSEGRVAAFFVLLEGGQIGPALVGDDPVVGTWAQHLRCHPLARGEVALGLRRWLDAERGEAPGATQAACWLDVKRTYMALRPALRRMYVTVEDVRSYWPAVWFWPVNVTAAEANAETMK